MHVRPDVDEIVRLITCEPVAPGAEVTAVALARCRKNFEGPVLDTLRETQNRLPPLLGSLPRDVRTRPDTFTTGEPTVYIFTTWLESLSKESRQVRNRPVSGSTLEGCESSEDPTL